MIQKFNEKPFDESFLSEVIFFILSYEDKKLGTNKTDSGRVMESCVTTRFTTTSYKKKMGKVYTECSNCIS